MHVEIPHNFSQKEAVSRIQGALHQSRAQLLQQAPDLQTEWAGNTLTFSATVQGKQITGSCEAADNQFIIDAKLPLLWRLFEGQIEKAIKEQVAGMR